MIVLGFSGISNGEEYRTKYGLRFVGHDSSIALIKDHETLFAAEEERFSRRKHTSEFPVQALRVGLEQTGIQVTDIDYLAYPWKVNLSKFLRMAFNHGPRTPLRHSASLLRVGLSVIRDQMSPVRVGRQFSESIGAALPRCIGVSHHLSHAACAFFTSPFERAAVLTIDGQGEDESGTLGFWQGNKYTHLRSIHSPHSIGIVYGMVTDFLGMRAAWDEYKVMGMAAYGDPARFRKELQKIVKILPDGSYRTKMTAMVFNPRYVDQMLSQALGIRPRLQGEEFQQVHFDLAASIQEVTEKIVIGLVQELRNGVNETNLCLGGGVFQNSVLNGKIRRSEVFDRVYVPPVPGDHGAALGAALYVQAQESSFFKKEGEFSAFLGPQFSEEGISSALQSRRDNLTVYRPAHLAAEVAQMLAADKVVAWFQGRMEYGPRALGKRSILANPHNPRMKEIINEKVKHREPFRPFAGAVPAELSEEYFNLGGSSPFMQFVVPIRKKYAVSFPAIDHYGTCRAQTVARAHDEMFHSLLLEFGKLAGSPILLNTSFNNNDEPIVCSPDDALSSFGRMNLDALAIGPFIVTRR